MTDATDETPEDEAAAAASDAGAEASESPAKKEPDASADAEAEASESPTEEKPEAPPEEADEPKDEKAEEALAAEKAEEALAAEKALAAEEALAAEKALGAPDEPAPAAEAPAAKPAEDSLPTPSGEVLIEAENLCKYYGQFTAAENVSFEVRRGQVVAFLGPNGAGKSTTMKILTGVLSPDRGQARIAGLSVAHNRIEIAHKMGYLPETGPLYQEMTPIELLRFFGEARGLSRARCDERISALVKRLDLESVRGKPIAKLSKGYRQRVGLAQSLLHEPDVLIMDEPTSGLDPNQIRDVRRIIREFAETKAILLSTHILQEVEAMADRVVFISRGRIVFQGDVQALLEEGEGSLDAAFARYTGVRYEEVTA